MVPQDILGQVADGAIGIDPQDINVWAVGSDHEHLCRVDACKHRHGWMMRVHFVDESRQFLDRVPHFGVLVLQVDLVANAPHQQRRMVLVFQHLLFQVRQLAQHCILIVVVHPRTLWPNIQAEGHGHVPSPSGVQQIGLVGAPQPDGVGTRLLEQFKMLFCPGTLDLIRLPIFQQLKTVLRGHRLHMQNLAPCGRDPQHAGPPEQSH